MFNTVLVDRRRLPFTQTDRRSLNRAKPPPIYLQREEAVTPGVWPRPYYEMMERLETHKSVAQHLPAAATTLGAAAKRHSTHAPSIKAIQTSAEKAMASRFRDNRRVVSEDVTRKDERTVTLAPSTSVVLPPSRTAQLGQARTTDDKVRYVIMLV